MPAPTRAERPEARDLPAGDDPLGLGPDDAATGWAWTPALILAVAAAFAVVVLTAGFYRSDWMLGDIAYHRGVAYTMQAGLLQGEGPFAGLTTYYGGLYSLGLGLVAGARSFDTVLSVVSWPATLMIPLALLLVGTRLWGRDRLAIALFVLLGTVGAPLHNDRSLVWVDSVLPMGSAFWPLYPRDVALALLVAGWWAVTSERRIVRVAVLGLVVGLTATFHAQMALLLAWFVAVTAIVRCVRGRTLVPFVEGAAAGITSIAVSAWWWIPRVTAVQSGGLLLGDYPGRIPLRIDPITFIQAFGVVGILALFGLALMAVLWRTHRSWLLISGWLAAFLPLVLVNRLVPSIELFTERRIWLVASIAIVALATNAAVLIVRALRSSIEGSWSDRGPVAGVARQAATWLVVAAIVAISIPGTIATSRVMRGSWIPGNLGSAAIDPARWAAVTARIHQGVRERGPTVLATYDSLEVWAWSFTGAQVPSAWLPGPIKLGFDPAALTGLGYLDRVRRVEAAFDAGPPGICGLQASDGVDVVLLEKSGGLVGAYDRTVASTYRVEPRDRSDLTIDREVGPGLRYVDQNGWDMLRLDFGASIALPWSDPTIGRLAIEARRVGGGFGPLLEVRAGTASYVVEATGGRFQRIFLDVAGADGISLTALEPVDVTRVTAFAPWPAADGQPEGLFTMAAADACAGIP
jgi:hypothetical protein